MGVQEVLLSQILYFLCLLTPKCGHFTNQDIFFCHVYRPIIAWTHETNIEKSPRLDYYYAADMAATRLDQLHLRLGYPYLYCHHQTCQHLVIFTELRCVVPTVEVLLTHRTLSLLSLPLPLLLPLSKGSYIQLTAKDFLTTPRLLPPTQASVGSVLCVISFLQSG